MKKAILLAAVAAVLVTACNTTPNANEAATADKQEAAAATGTSFNIDPVSSQVEWQGSKPIGTHSGNFKIATGSFSVNDGSISAGNFTIDINSLNNADLKAGEGKEKLEGHLKSADFFDATKYPTAKFEITAVEPLSNDSSATHRISGNLTLKDSTKNVSFPAKLIFANNNVTAIADFSIDRTKWGLFYGNDKSLGDKFISPDVNIKLNITANKL